MERTVNIIYKNEEAFTTRNDLNEAMSETASTSEHLVFVSIDYIGDDECASGAKELKLDRIEYRDEKIYVFLAED